MVSLLSASIVKMKNKVKFQSIDYIMEKKARSLMVLSILVLLSGCLTEATATEPLSTQDATALYSTSVAEVTAAFGQTATIQAYEATGVAAALTAAYTPSPIPTLEHTRPVSPSATPTQVTACNVAAPGVPMDVTIRDDMEIAPGISFTKIWRLENAGSCKWTRLYKLVFFSGNPMEAIQSIYLPGEVLPGNMIDLSVDMVAPLSAGTYQSNWMLMDAEGNLFGLGPNGDAPFWARIQVVQATTPTLTPTVTLTPTPIVYREGIVSLISGDNLDLDTGLTNQIGGLADMIYELVSPNHVISPNNGAGMMLFGSNLPGFSDCKDALVGSTPLSFEGVDPNVYICYRTNMGMPGRLHLISFDDENDALKLEFLTWSIP